MLTVYDSNRVTFAHHRGIVPPMPAQEGEKAVEKRYVCSAAGGEGCRNNIVTGGAIALHVSP